jgi:hypothetical protein
VPTRMLARIPFDFQRSARRMFRLWASILVASLAIGGLQFRATAAQGYVRFCTVDQSVTEAQLRASIQEQRNRFPVHQSDALIIRAATRAIRTSSFASKMTSNSISIAAREWGVLTGRGPYPPDEGILFQIGDPGAPTYALVTFESTGRVIRLRLMLNQEVASIFEFGRVMGAYILLNDLTASDSSFPRRGCQMTFRDQMYAMPAVLPEVLDAVRTPPVQDPALLNRVRTALGSFTSQAEASNQDDALIARRTLQIVGPNPPITVVYRDVDRLLGSKSEYDVVRLDGKKRAYAMFSVDANGKTDLGPMPICVVGDTSCAQYYSWP